MNVSPSLDDEIHQAHSEYVRALDKWIVLVVQKSHSDTKLIEWIKEDIQRNLKSYASFYDSIAKESEIKNDMIGANRYGLIGKVYQEIAE